MESTSWTRPLHQPSIRFLTTHTRPPKPPRGSKPSPPGSFLSPEAGPDLSRMFLNREVGACSVPHPSGGVGSASSIGTHRSSPHPRLITFPVARRVRGRDRRQVMRRARWAVRQRGWGWGSRALCLHRRRGKGGRKGARAVSRVERFCLYRR